MNLRCRERERSRYRVNEPDIQIRSSIIGIALFTSEGPCECIIENGVRHGTEIAGIVHQKPIRTAYKSVQLAEFDALY